MKVILFDGVCNLCNALVNWIIGRDKKNVFFFSSLQSEYGKRVVQQYSVCGDYIKGSSKNSPDFPNKLFSFPLLPSEKVFASGERMRIERGIGVCQSKNRIFGTALDTFILLDEDIPFYRSTAILRVLKYLGGVYSLAYVFIMVPLFIRNFFYDVVAKNRYRWFGKRDTCQVPVAELKSKFLEE